VVRTLESMTAIKRSRRLQAGLAGLSVVGALGAAVGLGLTTHTHTSRSSQGTTGSTTQPRVTSHRGGVRDGEGGDDGSRSGSTGSSSTRQSPVTPPTTTAPQATTSGS
jgi:hypothetical protein